jgi:hypothetical protein
MQCFLTDQLTENDEMAPENHVIPALARPTGCLPSGKSSSFERSRTAGLFL